MSLYILFFEQYKKRLEIWSKDMVYKKIFRLSFYTSRIQFKSCLVIIIQLTNLVKTVIRYKVVILYPFRHMTKVTLYNFLLTVIVFISK